MKPKLLQANIVLLVLSFILLIGVSFVPVSLRDVLTKVLLTAIFLTSVYVLGSKVRRVVGAVTVLIVLQWTAKLLGSSGLEAVAAMLNAVFFICIIARLITQFATAKDISPLVILGAVNGYLLLGLVFSIGSSLVGFIYPESFYLTRSDIFLEGSSSFHEYVYYAFMTMSTVGYGDVIPVSDGARALAIFISLTGQLYIAVVVAFLVGKFAGRAPH